MNIFGEIRVGGLGFGQKRVVFESWRGVGFVSRIGVSKGWGLIVELIGSSLGLIDRQRM